MSNTIKSIFAIMIACFLLPGCVEKASAEDIEKMCQKLTSLRGAADSENPADGADALNKCKSDPMIVNASKDVATCRIGAADIDTFWNRCK